MINSVNLVGRLTKDPEMRYTPNGVAVAGFTLAVNRPWKNEDGERDADFILCTAWRGTAEALANFTGKGSQVGVEGRIQTRTWDDEDGNRHYVTEVLVEQVHFLDTKKEEEQPKKGGTQKKNNWRKNK